MEIMHMGHERGLEICTLASRVESWVQAPAHPKKMMPSAKLTEVNVHLHFAAAASALFALSNPRPHNILWVHTFAAQAFTLPDQRMIFCHFILT